MSHGTPVQKVVNRVIALIDSIRVQAPGTKLFVESILPINETNGRWKSLSGRTDDIPVANMLIHAYCESLGITFVDIFSQLTSKHSNSLRSEFTTDGLHLNGEGYKVWASELHRYVERLEKQRRMPTIFDFLQPNYPFYEMNGDMNRGFLFKE
jgi:lysophospholipase L1-like esterase